MLEVAINSAAKHGLDASRLEQAMGLLRDGVEAEFLPACAAAVYRHGEPACIAHGGARIAGDPATAIERDTIFLVASLTKPVVCAGALLLLEQGAFTLEQPVSAFIPEFRDGLKDEVKLRHLFTHTSGLYDQLPRSRALRSAQAPIADYVRGVCETELCFAPGTRVSYQSMGILLIGEIVERITGRALRAHLREQLFEPLGMSRTTLGMPEDGMASTAHSLDAPFSATSHDVGHDWNTEYWRDFGAPWGGLHSTVDDLSRLLGHMLGHLAGPLSPALRRAMVRDQIALLPNVPATDKLTNRWGLGWGLGKPAFGDLVSPETFGHTGATGAMNWADPATHLSCVLLTNQPRLFREPPPAHAHLAPRFSNAVAASVLRSSGAVAEAGAASPPR